MVDSQQEAVNITQGVKFVDGVYESEWVDGRVICWLQNTVILSIKTHNCRLVMRGTSPINNRVRVQTPQTSFTKNLQAGKHTDLMIPIANLQGQTTVTLQFERTFEVEGDARTLCFQAHRFDLIPFKEISPSPPFSTKALSGSSLLENQLATTFCNGWLRMACNRTDEDTLNISGIIVSPLERLGKAQLLVNDTPVQEISYGLLNEDYASLGDVAFEGLVRLADLSERKNIRFSTACSETGQPVTPWYQDWIFPLVDFDFPLPDEANMRRIGSSQQDWFLFSGASFVYKLDDILKYYSEMSDLQECEVMDWGCGCGRLTRHLLDAKCRSVTGIDIDPVNIEWCKEHLTGCTFELVAPDLPSSLPGEAYDLIIGHSVFTHLAEQDQFFWLAELNRLLRPGGLAVVTVMTRYSSYIDTFHQEQFGHLRRSGFLDVGSQDDGVDIQKPGYYRKIFHNLDYIVREWANFFSIEAVLVGYSDHQTAIVLKKNEKQQ